ncbi:MULTISPECIES: hypothetical protein [unclassified Ensifer]|uniref:hypothetical protein n=1 Tax=unclassified Ensifer TaxID=2633371 RepID=UPI00081337A9|nr:MULTISPECIES: hypothetical protein [unclassified Ensifer]OCP09215.1 hypothetical protein BC374_01160 [Ensifer sp. LC13]OCP10402.1 hypothetical protein BBX50_01510 [Ensifer sp. LC11]OCP14094.1 hypothetical protein BC362_04445 [Ensifer sp. LC14]OCP32462.1 hypothetical protein BC364_01160 [Ensifer sp. LC499]
MRKRTMPIVGLGLLVAVAGCNSTEMLTPQVDVGAGTFRSPPVTQADLDAMSAQTDVAPVQREPVTQATAYSPQPAASNTPTAYATGDATYTDPAGSFEAQASRLAAGAAPVQNTIESHPTPVQQTAAAAEEIQSQPTVAALPKASAVASGTIRFLPIIGAPVQAVTPLSKQLGADARARGLTIKGSADASSEHILKGYFSALKDGDKTTVVYVWDVLDGGGNRLHRIQGQDSVPGGGADLWSAVPATTMQGIATKTIDAYLEWRQSQAG